MSNPSKQMYIVRNIEEHGHMDADDAFIVANRDDVFGVLEELNGGERRGLMTVGGDATLRFTWVTDIGQELDILVIKAEVHG